MKRRQLSNAEHCFYLGVIAIGRLGQLAFIGFAIWFVWTSI